MRPCLLAFAVVFLTVAVIGCGSRTPATPTESPTPGPAPTPEPTPLPPASLGCGLPPIPNPSVPCPRTSGSYQDIVTEALARLVAEHPELFDFENRHGSPVQFRLRAQHRRHRKIRNVDAGKRHGIIRPRRFCWRRQRKPSEPVCVPGASA